jgi:hypothetical protein
MTFEHAIIAFAQRFLSARRVDLIVAPALADWEYERAAQPLARARGRLAVLRAVAGAFGDELRHASPTMVMLTLVSASYYIFLLVIGFDVFSIEITFDFIIVAGVILILSFAPVMVCFWPERHSVPAAD